MRSTDIALVLMAGAAGYLLAKKPSSFTFFLKLLTSKPAGEIERGRVDGEERKDE